MLQLSFFLSTVSRTLNYTAWIRLDIYLRRQKRDFGGLLLSTLDLGRELWGRERDFFFCLLVLLCNKTLLEKRATKRDLSLSLSLIFIFISSSLFFKNFVLKGRTHTQKNAPIKRFLLSPFFFVCNRRDHRQSSIIVMGARSEIAMGGADVMTFVRSTRPGFPEGLKVRLLFFFFSLSHLFERRRRRPLFKLFSMVLVGGGGDLYICAGLTVLVFSSIPNRLSSSPTTKRRIRRVKKC